MNLRFLVMSACSALLASSCIFAPVSSDGDVDSTDAVDTGDTTDSTDTDDTRDVSDADVDLDTETDAPDTMTTPPCVDCVGTWAGSGVYGGEGGSRLQAQFKTPVDIAVGQDNQNIYLADRDGHRLWAINGDAVSPFAGTGACTRAPDGTPDPADDEFCSPEAVHIEDDGPVYVAECDTNRIRKIDGDTITTVAGSSDTDAPWEGSAAEAKLACPTDITSDSSNVFYIAGNESHRIHEFSNSELRILAGGEPGFKNSDNPEDVQFRNPTALAHDAQNERLLVVDHGNHCLRAVSLAADSRGATSTIAGDCENPGETNAGPASTAMFENLHGLTLVGDDLYFFSRQRLFNLQFDTPEVAISPVSGIDGVAHHADGPAARAKLHDPRSVVPFVDSRGRDSFLIAEQGGRTIRKWQHIDPAQDLPAVPGQSGSPTIDTVVGTGLRGQTRDPVDEATFASPWDIVPFGDGYLIADRFNHQILEYRGSTLEVFAGSGQCGDYSAETLPAADASFCEPMDLLVDGEVVYVVDRGHHTLRKIDSGFVSTVAGGPQYGDTPWDEASWEGPPTDAKLKFPEAVTMDADGNFYISGGASHAIHRLLADGSRLELFTKKPEEPGFDNRERDGARFRRPRDIVEIDGNLFVADYENHCIRRIADGEVTTAVGECQTRGAVGGAPSEARLDFPIGLLAVDYDDDGERELIILDRLGVSILDGEPVMVERVGATREGWRDGALNQVGLTRPSAAALAAPNELLVSESLGDRIRRIRF